MRKLKLLIISLIILVGVFTVLNQVKVYAYTSDSGDLTVSFDGDPPFFNELNLAPADVSAKTITITNNSSQAQDIAIAVTKYTDPNNLGSKLDIVIKKGLAELYGGAGNPKNLADLFTAGEVYLTTLNPGSTTDYDFEVTFDSQVDNNFQGKTTVFDFNVGFTAKPAPTPTPTVLGEEIEEPPLPPVKVLGVELPVAGANILKLAGIWAGFALTLAILPKIVNTVERRKSKSRKY